MFDNETIWLTITNIGLGVITIICLYSVGKIAYREIAERVRLRATVLAPQDDHSFVLSNLGITMADGGEPIDERALINKHQNDQANNEEKKN